MSELAAPPEEAFSAPDNLLPRCGAMMLTALIANNGITAIELDPPTETLYLRYDPRRTNAAAVEQIADSLRPALQRHGQLQSAGRAVGTLDRRPHLQPTTVAQPIGRIRVEAADAPTPPAPVPAGERVDPDSGERATRTADHKENAFLLKVVQPGLVGLMDGSVSTLAPLFATAFATHNHTTVFLVGLASALGAGISMGFAEALSDDGVLTGRGLPWMRGLITGGMTFVGGVGHTLPFLIPNINLALTLAYVVVVIELIAISLIRTRYFNAPFILSAIQVIVGGALVFGTGIVIGSA
jgi:erythrin-vacuolar iron transport family protein